MMVHIDQQAVEQSEIGDQNQVDDQSHNQNQSDNDQKQVDQREEIEMGQVEDSADQLKDGQMEGDEGDVTMVNEQVSRKEKNLSDNEAVVMLEEEEISTPALAIPSKSRSLRTTSVRKRLEIEVKMKQPKTKGRMSKKARLSKYRRKSANAKERERMKKQNDVFEVISDVLKFLMDHSK